MHLTIMVELGSILQVLWSLVRFSNGVLLVISYLYVVLVIYGILWCSQGQFPNWCSEHLLTLRCSNTCGMGREMSLRRQSEDQAEVSHTRGASMSPPPFLSKPDAGDEERGANGSSSHSDGGQEEDCAGEIEDLIDSEGYAGPALSEKTVKPLTLEALAVFNTAQACSGVIYISRIPPGMQPAKVRHLLSQYGEVGRVYLQQEGGQ